jgi:RNA polymerase sigma-70 factor (ECF subfamily)
MTVSEYNKSVDAHSNGVYRFILHNLRDADEAKDIVQDAFEKLWMTHETVNYEKVKSWLFTTAYRTMLDKIRRGKKSERMEEFHSDMLTTRQQTSDLKQVLREALDKLPEIQKSVIMLRDYEGYSYEEIGNITGLNESQVKVYIYRGRNTLKEYIGSVENVI